MTSSEQQVRSTRVGAVVEIAINRPHRKNAITPSTVAGLTDAFKAAEQDVDVACALLYGTEGAFCSGIDLKDSGPGTEIAPLMRDLHMFLSTMRTPTVVAVERYAINGGSGLALACDLMVIGESAFLQISEAAMGLKAPANVAWLTRKTSVATALRLTLSGERFRGADLPGLGVPAKVVPDTEVLAGARELANRIGNYPNDAGPAMKAGVQAAAASDGFTAAFDAARGA